MLSRWLTRQHKRIGVPEVSPWGGDPPQDPALPFELATAKLDRQLASVDALDAKLGNLFAWGGAALTVLTAVLALRPGTFGGVRAWVFFLAVAVYALLLADTLKGTAVKNWATGARPEQVIDYYREGDIELAARWRATRAFVTAAQRNQPRIADKDRCIAVGLALLSVELVAVVTDLALVAARRG